MILLRAPFALDPSLYILNKSYDLTSCNTEERIAQNIYIHNSNRNLKKINYNNNINQETARHRL